MENKSILSEAIKLLGWQGGTFHQVISHVCNMSEKERIAYIKKLQKIVAKSNIKDACHTFGYLYIKPIEQKLKKEISWN